jgi:putative membrane protein
MMYGNGFGWGWMWFGGVILLLILAALIVLIVRASTSGASSRAAQPPQPMTGAARRIAEDRLARGEITSDEFRQIVRALDEPMSG